MGGMRDRAASWLSFRTFRSQTGPADAERDDPARREKFPAIPAAADEDFAGGNEKDGIPTSSPDEQRSDDRRASSEARDPRSVVRVVPPWAHAEDDSDEGEHESPDTADPSSTLLPQAPASTQLAQHNHTPQPKAPTSASPPTAVSPSLSRANPPFPHSPAPPRSHRAASSAAMPSSRWVAFIATSGGVPAASGPPIERVPTDWLATHGPDYSQPWRPRSPPDSEQAAARWGRRRRSLWERWRNTLVRNPMVPLAIRLNVLSFSLVALGLGVRLFQDGNAAAAPAQALPAWALAIDTQTSPLMAIAVDAVAPPYLAYVTYDEYRGKPLGLRSATAKLRLVLLDLLFIVFDAANLSLAFESARATTLRNGQLRSDRSAAYGERLQWALACVLLAALLAWLMTFAISLLRLVARVER